MALTDIQKLSADEKEQFLSGMLETIERYNIQLSELEKRYTQIQCRLISPCYFNFRDALFHYEKAYQSQEVIQLYCEQNAMQEHLHRALKDGCIKYLQLLNERLGILYQYSCTPERLQALKKMAEQISEKIGKNLVDINHFGLNIIALDKSMPTDLPDEEYQILCEYLYCVNYYEIFGKKKLLQKCIHALRNLELDTRDSSMRIIQPFSVKVDTRVGSAPIDSFFKECDDQVRILVDEGLLEFIIAGKILVASQKIKLT